VFENGKDIFQLLKKPCFKLIFFSHEDKANFQDFENHSLNVSKLLFTEVPHLKAIV
jgi:hypothetical protein